MATPEGKVKDRIKKELKQLGAFIYMPVPSGFGVRGVPDFLACYQGLFIGIEAKAPGRRGQANAGLSKLQVIKRKEILDAGGLYFTIDGEDGDIEAMLDIIQSRTGGITTTLRT